MEINNALRMIVKCEARNNDTTSGFIRVDIIVEGREDMADPGLEMMPDE